MSKVNVEAQIVANHYSDEYESEADWGPVTPQISPEEARLLKEQARAEQKAREEQEEADTLTLAFEMASVRLRSLIADEQAKLVDLNSRWLAAIAVADRAVADFKSGLIPKENAQSAVREANDVGAQHAAQQLVCRFECPQHDPSNRKPSRSFFFSNSSLDPAPGMATVVHNLKVNTWFEANRLVRARQTA